MKVPSRGVLAWWLSFDALAVVLLVFGHGDRTDHGLIVAIGVVWTVGAFRTGPLPIPDRWWPSKDPDDYR